MDSVSREWAQRTAERIKQQRQAKDDATAHAANVKRVIAEGMPKLWTELRASLQDQAELLNAELGVKSDGIVFEDSLGTNAFLRLRNERAQANFEPESKQIDVHLPNNESNIFQGEFADGQVLLRDRNGDARTPDEIARIVLTALADRL